MCTPGHSPLCPLGPGTESSIGAGVSPPSAGPVSVGSQDGEGQLGLLTASGRAPLLWQGHPTLRSIMGKGKQEIGRSVTLETC